MVESGKSNWFYKLEAKPTLKHQNRIIGLEQLIGVFAEKSWKTLISCSRRMIPF
jgi:hypothetical protein